ncbi:hypothetical protein MCT05_06615 [Vibrio aestuarianus]|nr:hypothetical protein [Vibrio aestuarianus]
MSLFLTGSYEVLSVYLSFTLTILALFTISYFGAFERGVRNQNIESFLMYLCSFSIFGFILGNVFPALISDVVLGDSAHRALLGVWFFDSQVNIFSISLYRNQFFFWEPGLLQFYGNLLLMSCLFREQVNLTKVFISNLCVISTFSATGLVALIAVWSVYIVKTKNISTKMKLALGTIILCLCLPVTVSQLYSRLVGESYASGFYRMYDLTSALKVFSGNILFGIGYSPSLYESYLNEIGIVRGNSNGLVMIFVYFGFPLGLIFLIFIYNQRIFPQKNIFFMLYFLYSMSEPITFFPISFLFICSVLFFKVKNEN